MSGSDRDERNPPLDWFFPLVGLLLAIGIAWGIGYLQSREAEHRYHTPRAYEESAKAAAQRACAGREPGAMFECINEHVEASKEQANTEQDLSAQQRAASSALLAAMIAFATLVVTGVGVWFVKRTLEATLEAVRQAEDATDTARTAVDDTRRIGEAQVRAYLSIAKVELIFYRTGTIEINVEVRNAGQSPAKSAFIEGKISIALPGDALPGSLSGRIMTVVKEAVTSNSSEVLPPAVSEIILQPKAYELMGLGNNTIQLSFCLKAEDVFGYPIETPVRGYMITIGPPQFGMPYKMIPTLRSVFRQGDDVISALMSKTKGQR